MARASRWPPSPQFLVMVQMMTRVFASTLPNTRWRRIPQRLGCRISPSGSNGKSSNGDEFHRSRGFWELQKQTCHRFQQVMKIGPERFELSTS